VGAFGTTLAIAILLATLFTAWTPDSLFTTNLSEQLRLILTPQSGQNSFVSTPQPQLRIGIVAGHSGNDSGAVCRDATGDVTLTEADVNLKIATLVQQKLNAQGFQVDLLNEFDTRLNGYRAVALVSIHNDSCDFINEQATGFKVSAALTRAMPTAPAASRPVSWTVINTPQALRFTRAVSPPTCASITPFLKLTRIRLPASSKPVF